MAALTCTDGVLTIEHTCKRACDPGSVSVTVGGETQLISSTATLVHMGQEEFQCTPSWGGWEGTFVLICSDSILSLHTESCTPRGCEASQVRMPPLWGGDEVTITPTSQVNHGEMYTVLCASVDDLYTDGYISLSCLFGVSTILEAACKKSCPVGLTASRLQFGGVYFEYTLSEALVDGGVRDTICDDANPLYMGPLRAICGAGNLGLDATRCLPTACDIGTSGEASLGGKQHVESAPWRMWSGESFDMNCSSFNSSYEGIATVSCKRREVILGVDQCRILSCPVQPVEAVVGSAGIVVQVFEAPGGGYNSLDPILHDWSDFVDCAEVHENYTKNVTAKCFVGQISLNATACEANCLPESLVEIPRLNKFLPVGRTLFSGERFTFPCNNTYLAWMGMLTYHCYDGVTTADTTDCVTKSCPEEEVSVYLGITGWHRLQVGNGSTALGARLPTISCGDFDKGFWGHIEITCGAGSVMFADTSNCSQAPIYSAVDEFSFMQSRVTFVFPVAPDTMTKAVNAMGASMVSEVFALALAPSLAEVDMINVYKVAATPRSRSTLAVNVEFRVRVDTTDTTFTLAAGKLNMLARNLGTQEAVVLANLAKELKLAATSRLGASPVLAAVAADVNAMSMENVLAPSFVVFEVAYYVPPTTTSTSSTSVTTTSATTTTTTTTGKPCEPQVVSILLGGTLHTVNLGMDLLHGQDVYEECRLINAAYTGQAKISCVHGVVSSDTSGCRGAEGSSTYKQTVVESSVGFKIKLDVNDSASLQEAQEAMNHPDMKTAFVNTLAASIGVMASDITIISVNVTVSVDRRLSEELGQEEALALYSHRYSRLRRLASSAIRVDVRYQVVAPDVGVGPGQTGVESLEQSMNTLGEGSAKGTFETYLQNEIELIADSGASNPALAGIATALSVNGVEVQSVEECVVKEVEVVQAGLPQMWAPLEVEEEPTGASIGLQAAGVGVVAVVAVVAAGWRVWRTWGDTKKSSVSPHKGDGARSSGSGTENMSADEAIAVFNPGTFGLDAVNHSAPVVLRGGGLVTPQAWFRQVVSSEQVVVHKPAPSPTSSVSRVMMSPSGHLPRRCLLDSLEEEIELPELPPLPADIGLNANDEKVLVLQEAMPQLPRLQPGVPEALLAPIVEETDAPAEHQAVAPVEDGPAAVRSILETADVTQLREAARLALQDAEDRQHMGSTLHTVN
eukprot:TRINITY_DN19056_c0_g1_i1.p1 TRINITY_DN19056_c0_g1~~TRINITY_DN19056_c0_g1_i1.p1  ORF type:complete len:1242 (-),score=218.50 TRINITY_DN19056_c0_g1_i1:66-3650(-)